MCSTVPQLAVVSCLFSHQSDAMRVANLHRFLSGMTDQAVRLFVIEMAYDEHPFLVPNEFAHIRVRSSNRLWHKERLLNKLISALPDDITQVVWTDADLLFCEENWANNTSELLQDFAVIQPFSTAVRLDSEQTYALPRDERLVSFGYRCENANFAPSGGMNLHGHTGFAWAARRSFLEEVGLFDYCLSGSGDHVMAHGFIGDTESFCIRRHILGAPAYREAFKSWSRAAYVATGGRVSAVAGEIWHLFHGVHNGNVYMRRSFDLLQAGFNPQRDLEIDADGLYQINSHNPALRAWQRENFY